MPVTLRSETAVAGVQQPDADAKKDEDVECAICLEVIKPSDEVKLVCGHKLHGQCAVRHLQLDRRCPICRKQPRTRIQDEDEDEEEEYERMVDASEEIVIMRLVKKVKTETMRTLLRDFSIPETDLRQSKSNLAELVSEQLHYETVDEEGEEGEEGDDSDVEDGLMPA